MRNARPLMLILFLTIFSMLNAQVPNGFNYQSVVRNASGQIIANQAIGAQFVLHQTTPTGTSVYTETWSTSTNDYGLLSFAIGTGTSTDDFLLIDWSSGPYYLETLLDVSGGTAYVSMGTTQILSTPYALHAKTAESVTGTCNLAIGDTYAGGIIFYLDSTGCHGLVAKAQDEPSTYNYFSTYHPDFSPYAGATGIFAGFYNSKKIKANASRYAIQAIAVEQASLPYGGFDDWHLPSLDELDLMYINLHLEGIGGFDESSGQVRYWSSTTDGLNAYSVNFISGYRLISSGSNLIRAIRAF